MHFYENKNVKTNVETLNKNAVCKIIRDRFKENHH